MQSDGEDNQLLPPKRSLDPGSPSQNFAGETASPINIAPLRDTVAEAQNRRSMSRNRLGGIVIGLAIAAVMMGAAFWWGFELGRQAMDDTPLQIVRADPSPVKVPPQEPGGLQVPHQDKLVLRRQEADDSEITGTSKKIRPPPEEPLVLPIEPKLERPIETNAGVAKRPAADKAAGEIESSQALDKLIDTKVPAKPEDNEAQKPVEATPVLEEPPANSDDSVRDDKQSIKLVENGSSTEKEGRLANQEMTQELIAKKKAKVNKNSSTFQDSGPITKKAGVVRSGQAYHVQLASYRSKKNAMSGWNVLKRRYDSLLGKLSSRIVQVKLPNKGIFYRLQVGPLRSSSDAKLLCEKIIAQKQGCLVVPL